MSKNNDKIKDLIEEKNTNQTNFTNFLGEENYENHINNMVPPNSKKSPKTTPKTVDSIELEQISRGMKKSRVLIDLFAASVSPLVNFSGWGYKRDEDGNIRLNKDGSIEKFSIGALKGNDVKYEINGQEFVFTTWDNMVLLKPKEFIRWFFNDPFSFLQVECDESGQPIGDDIGGGRGYTGGQSFALFSKGLGKGTRRFGRIQLLYCDPDTQRKNERETEYKSVSNYTLKGTEVNYIRQRINIKITGDGLQVLRERKLLMKFLLTLWKYFRDPKVTMFDATCDFFNYGIIPKYFANLYEKKCYTGRSTVNVMGPQLDPTVYIGAYKADRTVMLYDKLIESEGKKGEADEPDLLEALHASKNSSWLRLEQHFTGKENHGQQVFNFLLDDIWLRCADELDNSNAIIYDNSPKPDINELEKDFWSKFSSFLKQQVSKKCRFLKRSLRTSPGHPERIPTDKHWARLLATISETTTDFAFKRPILTLEDRKDNFIAHGIGGMSLFTDVLEIEGGQSLDNFLSDIKAKASFDLDTRVRLAQQQ